MQELRTRGERIDRVTVAGELKDRNQLESVDGVTYLVSLDEGMPAISNLDAYVRIVEEKAHFGAPSLWPKTSSIGASRPMVAQ